jgi:uncharacterized protein involved in exopolysaccharide biosynthesis
MPNDFTSRPGRGGPPNDPMPSLVLRAPEAAPQRRWTARDLAVRLFYRFRLFLGCLILGIIAGLALAVVTKTVFTAETVLIVLLGPDSVLIQDSLDLNNTPISIDGLKAVQSEIQIIQSDIVMRAAVQDVGLDKLYPNRRTRRGRWGRPSNAFTAICASTRRAPATSSGSRSAIPTVRSRSQRCRR